MATHNVQTNEAETETETETEDQMMKRDWFWRAEVARGIERKNFTSRTISSLLYVSITRLARPSNRCNHMHNCPPTTPSQFVFDFWIEYRLIGATNFTLTIAACRVFVGRGFLQIGVVWQTQGNCARSSDCDCDEHTKRRCERRD